MPIADGDGTNNGLRVPELLVNIDNYPNWKELGANKLEQTVRESLEWKNEERLVFVAELEHRLVGYAVVYWQQLLFSSKEGYVSELFIRSDASGQGVGTALLETIKTQAVARGCIRLTLVNLKDRESYRRGFYASRGWEEKSNTVRFALNLEVTP